MKDAKNNLMKDLLTNSIVAITQFQAAFANVDQIVPRSGSHSTTDIIEPEIKHPFWRMFSIYKNIEQNIGDFIENYSFYYDFVYTSIGTKDSWSY